MERSVYERMNEIEATHWWFAARRDIIKTAIDRLIPPLQNGRILEAGCGTGGNLAMLQKFGQLDAFEFDENAREVAIKKSGMQIPFGALPDKLPFEPSTYDLVGLFDVLEHVEQDQEALAALGTMLSPTGRILVTVPAFPWLWSKHDERHHHFRRYTRSSLQKVARDAGLLVERSFYFNSLLFPVAIGTRAIKAITRRDTPDDALPAPWLNRSLYSVFSFERHFVRRLSLPFGLSLCAVIKAS